MGIKILFLMMGALCLIIVGILLINKPIRVVSLGAPWNELEEGKYSIAELITQIDIASNPLKFEKVYFGNIPVYVSRMTFVVKGRPVIYDLYLRNDPEEMKKNIKVDITNSRIKQNSYVSFASEIESCTDKVLSAWRIGEFLGVIGINNSGTTTKEKTCEDSTSSDTIIILQKSKTGKPFISQEYESKTYQDCFVLNYNDCETLPVTERFILNLIENMKKNEL